MPQWHRLTVYNHFSEDSALFGAMDGTASTARFASGISLCLIHGNACKRCSTLPPPVGR
jgi:hypothetical protein